ncbi:MAG: protein kinase family protein, partial [Methylococcales bacterium]
WKVVNEKDESFALKIVSPFPNKNGRKIYRSASEISMLVERAEKEIAVLKQLPEAKAHHILPCLDSGTKIWQNRRLPVMVTPRMVENLSVYCRDSSTPAKPFTLEQSLTWFGQLAQALEYFHAFKNQDDFHIHRDIKPENILLDHNGDCYLIDFGILKIAPEFGTASAAYTKGYWAPEQRLPLFQFNRHGKIEDRYYLTPKVDCYALGLVMHLLFAGDTRAQGDLNDSTTLTTHARHVQERVDPMNPAVPVGLLGKVGGLAQAEVEYLRRVLINLQKQSRSRLSSNGTIIGSEPDTPPCRSRPGSPSASSSRSRRFWRRGRMIVPRHPKYSWLAGFAGRVEAAPRASCVQRSDRLRGRREYRTSSGIRRQGTVARIGLDRGRIPRQGSGSASPRTDQQHRFPRARIRLAACPAAQAARMCARKV